VHGNGKGVSMSFANTSIRRCAALALLGFLTVAASETRAQAATGEFHETLNVSGPLELDVATGAGAITIQAGTAGQVAVAGKIRVGRLGRGNAGELVSRIEAAPPIVLEGNVLTIGRLDDPDLRRDVSISYEIEVPPTTRVTSHTGSGDQRLTGVEGPVVAETGSGKITLSDIGGPVEARTGSGSIDAERIAGGFAGHTGSGSVRLVQTASGDIDVSTGSGSCDLTDVQGAAHVRTGSGSITLSGIQEGPWDLQTGSGSIRVALPADAAFDLDARSSSGSVHTEHPVTVQGRVERGTLRGPVRGGGPLLQARTGSGEIRLD
jgi:Toastrack DUF4097